LLETVEIIAARGHDQRRTGVPGRKRKIAFRNAAGNLQVDDPIADPVSPDRFAQHHGQRS